MNAGVAFFVGSSYQNQKQLKFASTKVKREILGASWKCIENYVLQQECFTLSTVFIRFVEPEISVGLRVSRDASETMNAEVPLFVSSS